ncbi:hypothetical protein J2T57_001784 [Natronocella acetinitrilica]|uniref:NAD/FAD-utilizing enzyme n=1 Tax=Natronocella acetinitrilica TaxID=414046 RepID=A0AAE3KBG5_9GAMM|nr:NAD/FAD-utilizing enzyme [Natronocella acetinitrilica]MCP1674646.1 hypothetical protein [Natronocella acetinitrilica]
MRLKRYFFISNDLDDLERFEEDLENAGIVTPQIHVLTLDDTGADFHHHLHTVTDFMKRDVLHSTLICAAAGACLAVLVLLVAYFAGWTDSPAGWMPFIFLAIIVLGFVTWEGGLRGIDTPNSQFQRFERALRDGKHVFFVDIEPGQEKIVNKLAKNHPTAQSAGTAPGAPRWLVFSQHRLRRFFADTFP